MGSLLQGKQFQCRGNSFILQFAELGTNGAGPKLLCCVSGSKQSTVIAASLQILRKWGQIFCSPFTIAELSLN